MAPIMVLFEDFDNVFHGRENITGERGGGLTFDCFLNCLGGIENADGVFVALTTNKVELLDEALGVPGKDGMSTRPGRLDRLIEFKPMNEDQRRRTVARILKDSPQHVDAVVVDTEGMGGAQVVEHCVALALDKFWKEEKL
jgi:SpoVK/Ycf46/Vps4 family AAA+-type ATPase